ELRSKFGAHKFAINLYHTDKNFISIFFPGFITSNLIIFSLTGGHFYFCIKYALNQVITFKHLIIRQVLQLKLVDFYNLHVWDKRAIQNVIAVEFERLIH